MFQFSLRKYSVGIFPTLIIHGLTYTCTKVYLKYTSGVVLFAKGGALEMADILNVIIDHCVNNNQSIIVIIHQSGAHKCAPLWKILFSV